MGFRGQVLSTYEKCSIATQSFVYVFIKTFQSTGHKMSFYFIFFSQSDLGHTYTKFDIKNIYETRKSGRNYERVM